MESVDPFSYTGKDVLENLACMSHYNATIVSLIKRHMRENEEKILDFGAGIATISAYFPKDRLICLEIDESQSQCLQKQGFQTIKTLQSLEDGSLSFVFSSNVLEHIEDDKAAIQLLYTKMQPGARLVFYVPAFPFLYSKFDKEVGHFRRYTKQSLRQVFQSASFSVDKVFYSDCLGFLAGLLFKWRNLGKKDLSMRQLSFYDSVLFPISRRLDSLIASNLFGKNVVIYATKI